MCQVRRPSCEINLKISPFPPERESFRQETRKETFTGAVSSSQENKNRSTFPPLENKGKISFHCSNKPGFSSIFNPI